MSPKFKFEKREIINVALNVTREKGVSGLTARALAAEIGCSAKEEKEFFKLLFMRDRSHENMEENKEEISLLPIWNGMKNLLAEC